ncbi:O-methyltransferase [Kribbella voronezhensis]|uniref:O-methyltransferase n=1 Tax=Kribbella voronezhensis TaxID=2512212 RepID=A0A4R7TGH7_9ACTN|nr:methyltransferase [Kribbella voronezhensis]TDU90949.1 O-methyltransferase [Kribbella voronezhensis]
MTDPLGPAELAAMADLIPPMALRAAATLRLADLLAAGPIELSALADKAGADEQALSRLMRYLVARGIFSGTATGYELGESGKWLLDDAPGGLRRWLDLDGFGGHMDRAFFELLGTVKAGGPVAAGNKTSLDPKAAGSYDELMEIRAVQEAPLLAAALDWSAYGHVVDVGGGTGAQLVGLLEALPHLRGTLVDLPVSAPAALERFRAKQLTERTDVLAGDLFELELPSADVFVFRYLLHSFEDEAATDALRQAARALKPGGCVLVVESAETSPIAFASMDLLMLVLGHGRERTLAEYDELATAAGLTRSAIHQPAVGPRVLEYR